MKEDMEDDYEAVTKRKFADHVCVGTLSFIRV